MSDRFPTCSQIDSNNSGINVSIPSFNRRLTTRVVDYSVRFFSPLQTVEMSASSMQGDASASRNYASDIDASPQRRPGVGDQIPSSPSSNHEVSGAMIEVITVEKYKRSDGFANPYHIQGLNASTPDDVDDEDDEDEEEGVGQIPERERTDSNNTISKHENADLVAHEDEQIEETIVMKDVDEEDSVKLANKDLKSKHPSIPTSAESTVSSESPCLSNTSSVVPSQSTMAAPRSDSVSSGVGQPQRLFKFTVERVPSSDSNNDQTPTAESQTAHITPPVSVSRAPTSDSIFVPEVPSDTVSVDEPLNEVPTSQTADVIHPSRAPWIPQDYPRAGPTGAELPAQMSHWASAEMAAAAAATAAVASAVVNPVVSSQDSQAMAMGQSNQPHFNIAVAAASAAVAAINNMMIDPNLQPSNVQHDLSAFGHHHKPSILNPELPGISGYSPYGQPDVIYQHHSSSIPPSTVSAMDRVSTPSPGPPTQSSVATPPPSEDSRALTADTVDTRTERENDEGEIRFRRARYLEKRERWHDKRFLVVDTFRREEPVSRPEVKLPDPTFPLNCKRCLEGTKSSQARVRTCPCSSESAATLQQWTDRHRYPDHAENHGYIPAKNKYKADNNFGYPETIAIMERATQLAYRTSLAASIASPRGSSCEIESNVEAVGKAAAAAAAVAASFSNSGGREPNLACSAPSPTIPNVTLRRKGLQRNNSHFHIARSSPSSFSANEIQPQVDHVAAMAVAAVVSVTAAMASNDRRERGLHSERSSETEHPINPPTSPASGHMRDSLNRSSSVPEVTSLNSKTTLPSVDNRTIPVNNNSAERNSSSIEGSSKTSVTAVAQGPTTTRNASQAQSFTTGAMSSTCVDHQVSTTSSVVPNGRHNERKQSDGTSHAESSDDKVKQAAPQESHGSLLSQTSLKSSSAIHSISNQTIPEQSHVSPSSQHPATKAANEGQIPAAQIAEPTASPAVTESQMEAAVPPPSQTNKPKKSPKVQLPSNVSLQHSIASTSGSGMVSTGSMGTTEPYKLSQAPSSGTPQSMASDMSAAAAFVAHGLMMSNPLHGASGVPLMPGEPGVISAAPSVGSNTSSMNYLDQYRMQHILPVGPSASSSAAPEPPRQTTEARIAQSLDHVRLAMISYFRELEDKHTYQIKSLQEEVRQLREQRERDLAIIREYVPHECLLQLGHPYSSLAKVSAPQSSRSTVQNSMNSTSVSSTIQPSQMSQATDPSASTPASQSHLHSMHSTQPE